MLKSHKTKVVIGLLISLVFLFLAFRKVDFSKMYQAFVDANYWFILLGVGVIIFSHWVRAVRWGVLLQPVRRVKISSLFDALMIGYMFNVFLPAHLGEFVRAYVLGKKNPVPASAVFGTIVIERIIDVFTLLLIMALTIVVFPFPEWVRTSGYISFVFIGILFVILLLMKKYRDATKVLIKKAEKFFPEKFTRKFEELLFSFLDGVVPLKHWYHYITVFLLSVLMWAAYAFIFQLVFYAFDFTSLYSLPWYSVLVLLVVTTISILVPSSPGYVGTYHYLCQLALGLFLVPKGPALSFAVIMHGINILPVLVLGLIILSLEGMSIKGVKADVEKGDGV